MAGDETAEVAEALFILLGSRAQVRATHVSRETPITVWQLNSATDAFWDKARGWESDGATVSNTIIYQTMIETNGPSAEQHLLS